MASEQRKTKTLEDLTPEMRARIPDYQNRALEGVMDGGRYQAFNYESAKAAVDWNYKRAGYEPPAELLVAENPKQQQEMYKKKHLEVYGKPYTETAETYMFTLNVYSDCLYAWWKFIKTELDITIDGEDEFEECFGLQRASNIFSIICDDGGFAVACKYPTEVHHDSQFRLHNAFGQAVKWGVDHPTYYIMGRSIPADLYKKWEEKTYTLEDFARESDEEIKSAFLAFVSERWGNDYIATLFSKDLKEVDTYVDKKAPEFLAGTTGSMNIGVYTLFKGYIAGEEVAFVRCYCPSSDRMFYLGVDPINTDPKDAIASLYRIPRVLAPHIEYINRQGERFFTVFGIEGQVLADNLTKEETEDLVSISGDEYFSKMRYEY